jgi:hypothetical protein
VLLTAAHCLRGSNGFSVGVVRSLAADGQPVESQIEVTCETHPRYWPQGLLEQLDYALCLLSAEYPDRMYVPGSDAQPATAKGRTLTGPLKQVPVRFERLSLDVKDAMYRLGDERSRWVLLAGRGCTKPDLSTGVGTLSDGLALVTQRSVLQLMTGAQDRRDSATLCQGDSGGGAFRIFTPDRNGPRHIVAINSRNIIVDNQVQQVSFLVKTSAPPFVEFFRSWKQRNGDPAVCGLDPSITPRCHD